MDPFSYSSTALLSAVCSGDLSRLEWWWEFDRNLYLEVIEELIDQASELNEPIILQWLFERSDDFPYDATVIDKSSEYGAIASLEWWKNSGLELRYTENAMMNADCFGKEEEQIETLNWWRNSGLFLKYNERCIWYASRDGDVKILQWWQSSGLLIKYDARAMDDANNCEVLEWWVHSGLELRYTRNHSERHPSVIKWWITSGLELDS